MLVEVEGGGSMETGRIKLITFIPEKISEGWNG